MTDLIIQKEIALVRDIDSLLFCISRAESLVSKCIFVSECIILILNVFKAYIPIKFFQDQRQNISISLPNFPLLENSMYASSIGSFLTPSIYRKVSVSKRENSIFVGVRNMKPAIPCRVHWSCQSKCAISSARNVVCGNTFIR